MKGIKCIAPVFDMSGYAQWSRSYILSLMDTDIPITLSPISFEKKSKKVDLDKSGERLQSIVGKSIEYDHVITWLVPEISSGLLDREPAGVKKICMSLWETDRLPDSWCKTLGTTDELWVCGEWNAAIYRKSLKEYAEKNKTFKPIPIKVVPYPITEPDEYKTMGLEEFVNGAELFKDSYKFYCISQWNERKNFKDLLYAYWSEFDPDEKVVLVLKTYIMNQTQADRDTLQEELQKLANNTDMQRLPPIMLLQGAFSSKQMSAIHSACDCYVSSSRGEGLGLGIIEATLAENPVVVNEFGEHCTYLSDECRWTYNHGLTPVTGMAGYTWYHFNQSWAIPDVNGMSKQMRAVFESQDLAITLAHEGKRQLLNTFTKEETVKRILELLNE